MMYTWDTMKTFDVTALGEILIDFTSAGLSPAGQALYERNAGGAPANVAVAVSRLGGKSAFIGKTGNDSFGSFLKDTLARSGVETKGMRTDNSQHTTLAFVTLASGGERTFSFCRNPGADTQLAESDLDESILDATKILHVGSLSLTHEPARSATLAAIARVKKSGGIISYDPNWRAPLWSDRVCGIEAMKSLFQYADIVKVSDEELSLLFGIDAHNEEGLASGAIKIMERGARLVLVTLGARGVYYRTRTQSGMIAAPNVSVVDTTGAGDSFVGGLLFRLSRTSTDLDALLSDSDALTHDLVFANAVASICVTRRGAIPAMPTIEEVETFLRQRS